MAAPVQVNHCDLFPGSSDMARRMRELDWSATAFGPSEKWPDNLRLAVSLCLTSRFPIVIWWGPSLSVLYNDAYIPFLGPAKHPLVLGRPGRECWGEIWYDVGPMLERVLATGEATWLENYLFFFDRKLPLEEVYVTFTYSPILGADGQTVEGVFTPCYETSEQVVGARRLETLRKLGIRTGEPRSVFRVCNDAATALRENPRDIPLVAIYIATRRRSEDRLRAFVLPPGDHGLPRETSDLRDAPASWPILPVLQSGTADHVDLAAIGVTFTRDPYPEPVREALLLPIPAAGQDRPAGVLAVGISPRRVLDADYRTFLDLVVRHLGTALDEAKVYEEGRKRAEALAEIDRAKIAFFSNVSHEFRTPLTLILSPLEDSLADDRNGLPAPQRERLQVAHRNSLRLLKLVNTLLDFSRIEAGRMQASFQPVDLGAFTAELASNFRSVCQRAGIALRILSRPAREDESLVYVDREMWEKIVLNLLSNAFKFTLAGSITVSVMVAEGTARLIVIDTGTGIPGASLPHLFERFYQVPGSRGRTGEGSGIGLSLVHELVKLHGGTIKVTSVPEVGTTFTVFIPLGSAHLPPDRIADSGAAGATAGGSRASIEEAERWVRGLAPEPETDSPALSMSVGPSGSSERHRILWADDNADMREYVQRLLGSRYEVEAVPDGASALRSARARPPDLVLSDIMMPGMDGIELLRRLRADPHTQGIPVILLSARAGEESRVAGLETGADDYLVKPFSARELLARVGAHLELVRARREAEQQVIRVLESISDGLQIIDADWHITYLNPAARRMLSGQGMDPDWMLGKHAWEEIAPDAYDSPMGLHLRRAMEQRISVISDVYFEPWGIWFHNRIDPLPDGGIAHYFQDITPQKKAEEAQRLLQAERDELLERMNLQFERMPIGCILFGADRRIIDWNPAAASIFGYRREEVLGKDGPSILLSNPLTQEVEDILHRLGNGDLAPHSVIENITGDGRTIVCEWHNTPLRDSSGRMIAFLSMVQDITGRIQAEEKLAETRKRLAAELAAMTQLQKVSTRLVPAGESPLLEIVDTAIVVTGADMGNIQLLDPASQTLGIVASRVFERPFLDYFSAVQMGHGSCGTALLQHSRVVIEDVTTSPILAGTPELEVILAAGVRAVQSTPLVGRSGRVVGMLSTHCRAPHAPDDHDLQILDLLARQAADWIERTQSEQALAASEERFRRYFELGLIGMAITSPTRGVLEVNDQLCEILGYPRSDLVRMSWAEITHPHDLPQDLAEFERVLAGEIDGYSLDKRWIRPDGGIVYTGISVNCVRKADGSVDYFVALVQDITERKLAEGALRESEARYRSLVAQVKDYAIFSTNEVGVVTTWNEGCEQVLRYSRSELIGMDSAKLFSAEDQAAGVPTAQLEEAIEKGAVRNERWMVAKGGGRFYGMGTTTALTNVAGELIGFSMVLRDITLMKLSQDELAQRGEKLARLVTERTDELERTTERLRLSERMASLGTLSAGLGHDLGNLLLPIDVRLKLLLDANLPQELRDHVVGIEKSSQYLQRLAAGLRSLAVDPATTPDEEATELRSWLDDVGLVLKSLLPRGITFEHVIPALGCWVAIKPVSLTQVIFNLVQNAADAMQERQTGCVRLSVSDDSHAEMVVVRVSDDGPGMSEDVIRHCIEPYFSTKPRGMSTGMGLSFVHSLVAGAGGRVEIDSSLGQGTTITLLLPRAYPPQRLEEFSPAAG